jgi:hypothetical protein
MVMPVITTGSGVLRGASVVGSGGAFEGGSGAAAGGGRSRVARAARASFMRVGFCGGGSAGFGGGGGGATGFGGGASTTWMNKATFSYPPFLAYSILHAIAAFAVIYGLCKLEPWARTATFTFLIVNLLVGVPITGKAIIESSKQVDAQVEAQMESNGVRIEHSAPGTTTITPSTPPSATPPTPDMPPSPTTVTPSPSPSGPPGTVTFTTPRTPGGLGFFGLGAAIIGLVFLGVVAFFRLILDTTFIILLCSREVREVYA